MDDRAASPVVGWIVAAVVFTGSLAAVLSLQRQPLTSSDTEDEDLRSKANGGLDLILTTPGMSLNADEDWHLDPENLLRFGLSSPTANYLSYDKLSLLRKGSITSLTNGLPDYPEVKDALSLTGYDFHLRTFPILLSIDDAKWTKYRGIRAAYLGHFESGAAAPPAVTVSVSTNQLPVDYTEFTVDVTPTDGPASNVFQVTLDLDTGEGHHVQNLYTPEISVGTTATVTARYYDLDWTFGNGDYAVTVTVTDAATGTAVYNMAHVIPLERSTTRAYALMAEPSKNYYHSGQDPVLLIDKWKEDGSRYRADGVSATYEVYASDGALVDTGTVTLPKNKEAQVTVNMGTYGAGTYSIFAHGNGMSVGNRFVVRSNPLDTGTHVPSYENKMERGYLEFLIEGFNNNTYFTGHPEGDVFRDHQDDTAALGSLLPRYDLLVVGSGITQSQLQGQFKHSVRDWVEAGGTLVVLGTAEGNVQWLKSIFGAGSQTATGGISTPDPNHPVLHVPEKLRYRSYNDYDMSYKIDSDHQAKFTHVILKDEDNLGGTEDVLAVSNPGAYGDGTVILTSYMPPRITEPYDHRESIKLLHNLMTQGFNMLFIDYGPPIPPHARVGSASRLAVVPHPEMENVLVEVRIIMYTWR